MRMFSILFIFGISILLAFTFKFNNPSYMAGLMLAFICLILGKSLLNYIKKVIISKAKYPLAVNLLCNIIGLRKPYYFGRDTFDLDEMIHDNKLPLTFNYITNSQYPILQFNKNKILFHNQEFDWKNFKWKYCLHGPAGYKSNRKYLIEFEGINQDNIQIKNKIEFEKIKTKENEVILLFVIHDLLFGKKSSYYY